jgi:hypothetical protein
MTWLCSLLEPTAIGNRLALLIAGLRATGGLFFVFLSIYFAIQGGFIEATLSVVAILAWVAATTEAMDLVLERLS